MSEDFDKRLQEVNKQMRGDFDGRFEFDYFPEIEKVFRRYRYNGCDYGHDLPIEERRSELKRIIKEIINKEAKP